MKIGSIVMYGKIEVPTGYLLCNGSAVSRTTYANLFSVISTAFGVGDGSTTFNLPNLLGKAIFGKNSSETEFDTLGKAGGVKTINLEHSHTMTSHSHSTVSGSTGTPNRTVSIRTTYQIYGSTATHTHTISAGIVGNSSDNGTNSQLSTAQSVLNPYVIFYPLIKT